MRRISWQRLQTHADKRLRRTAQFHGIPPEWLEGGTSKTRRNRKTTRARRELIEHLWGTVAQSIGRVVDARFALYKPGEALPAGWWPITEAALAELIGVHHTTVSHYLRTKALKVGRKAATSGRL